MNEGDAAVRLGVELGLDLKLKFDRSSAMRVGVVIGITTASQRATGTEDLVLGDGIGVGRTSSKPPPKIASAVKPLPKVGSSISTPCSRRYLRRPADCPGLR